jgi:hypothetical protein
MKQGMDLAASDMEDDNDLEYNNGFHLGRSYSFVLILEKGQRVWKLFCKVHRERSVVA